METAASLHNRTSQPSRYGCARSGRLRQLPKIQAKTEENILKSIASLKQRTGRSLIHHARAAANEMISYLRGATTIEQISI